MAGPIENEIWSLRHLPYLDYLVTPPHERIPITLSTFGYTLVPSVLLFTLAYLARRPNTRLIRLAILPFAVIATLRTTYGYQWQDIRLNCYNFGAGLAGLAAVFKALEYGLAPKGILKLNEIEPGVIATPAIELRQSVGNGHDAKIDVSFRKPSGSTPSSSNLMSPPTFIDGIHDALEVLSSLRGIGWQYGSGTHVYIPKENRDVTNKRRFMFQTLRRFIIYFLTTDFIEACFKLVPGVGTPTGGSIFAFGSNAFEKYAISTILHFATGFGFITGFTMVYDFVTLLAITFLGHSPTSWPPIFERPWATDNLHSFWAKQWHQLLRQTFLVMGGYPFQALFGSTGLVFGTFLASGLYHDWAMYSMGQGTDRAVWLFFVGQAFGIAAERFWRVVTGRRVGGWPGTAWAWLCVIGGGQWCTDAWHRRGFLGGLVVPPILSPTRLVLFPLILKIYAYYSHTS